MRKRKPALSAAKMSSRDALLGWDENGGSTIILGARRKCPTGGGKRYRAAGVDAYALRQPFLSLAVKGNGTPVRGATLTGEPSHPFLLSLKWLLTNRS